MIEILSFIFSDPLYFFGSLTMLMVIVWGISNFTLVRINISNYQLRSKDVDTELDDEEL